MLLANLPAAISNFVEAARAGNIRNLVADFTADAVVRDRGREHRGPEIVHWGNWSFTQSRKLVFPIRVDSSGNRTLLSVAICDRGRTNPEHLEWAFTLIGPNISALSIQTSDLPELPRPVFTYFFAVNSSDLNELVNVFAESAVVNDRSREHRGIEAIRHWAARDIIDKHVTLYVVKAHQQGGDMVVTAESAADNETTRASEFLDLIFSIAGEKIIRLNIVHSESYP